MFRNETVFIVQPTNDEKNVYDKSDVCRVDEKLLC